MKYYRLVKKPSIRTIKNAGGLNQKIEEAYLDAIRKIGIKAQDEYTTKELQKLQNQINKINNQYGTKLKKYITPGTKNQANAVGVVLSLASLGREAISMYNGDKPISSSIIIKPAITFGISKVNPWLGAAYSVYPEIGDHISNGVDEIIREGMKEDIPQESATLKQGQGKKHKRSPKNPQKRQKGAKRLSKYPGKNNEKKAGGKKNKK